RVGIYLLDGQRLTAAAGRAIEGRHAEIAERLLELALGRYRARGYVAIEDAARDPRLAGAQEGLEACGIEAALALPLIVRDATLDAVASMLVEALDVDAAVIRMIDARNDSLVLQAISVADAQLGPAFSTIFGRPDRTALQRQLRARDPLVLDPESARLAGPAYSLLVPFLEKGSSAVVLPIATPAEALAVLTLVSLDPARTIDAA